MRYLQSATTSRQRGLERGRQRGLVRQQRGYQSIDQCPTHDGSRFGNFMVCVTDMTSRLH